MFFIKAAYVTIEGFTVTGAFDDYYGCGISLNADYCNISNNTILNNYDGIRLYCAYNNIITNNKCFSNKDDGIELELSSDNMITNNHCLSNNDDGIYLYKSDRNTITNNECSYNKGDGIYLCPSNGNTITNNECFSNNYGGIYLHSSDKNTITNNKCSNNYDGIYLDHSDRNIITNNYCSNNKDGIKVWYSSNNTITNNKCFLNNRDGSYLWHSNNNTITSNNWLNNYCDGICLESSNNNRIYLNNFINNTDNVYSYESTNIWNSTSKITYIYNGSTYTNYLGNYWDDYTGGDADGDGIGDTPYGIGIDKDNYPLMEPWENYFKLPEEKIFDNGIWWIKKDSSELYFGWMKIYLDGEYKGECSRLDFGHKVEGADSWPQVAAIYASGYIRLKECRDPDINFGTSFVLGPGYWEGSNYYHNVTIKEIRINSSKPFEIRIKAILPHFNVTYDIEMFEPNNETMKIHVDQIYECTNQFTLDESRLTLHEGFKIVQLSSMYINGTHHDSDGVKYIDEEGKLIIKKFEDLKTSQFIFDVPKKFGENWLECTHSDDYGWQGNTPNCIISLDNLSLARECTPQGWITITSNPNDDNVGLWIHHDKAKLEWNEGDKGSISYWLIAQDNPKIICVPTDYPTIQEAVDNATARDMIIVRDGTYTENVDVNKHLAIRSENGSANCIVQAANPDDHVFEIIADYVNISGFTITGATGEGHAGIRLYHNCTISNNNISNNMYGIRGGGYRCILNNNNISNNKGAGVYSVMGPDSNNITITNNVIISNNGSGIDFRWSRLRYSVIANNTVDSNKGVGIGLGGTRYARESYGTVHNAISNNIVNSNDDDGISIGGYSAFNIITNNNVCSNYGGITLGAEAEFNNITNNNISKNSVEIDLQGSKFNTITNNTINLNYNGISIPTSQPSNNNVIYLNNFLNNTKHVYYFHDSPNIWNSTSKITYTYIASAYTNYMGNYWSDYKGKDTNKDGIGDTPYSIVYSDKDYYPLMELWENYFIPLQNIFDTGAPSNPYPSIFGTHNGTIKPNKTIIVSKLYTYPCVGTGGHTEYATIWNSTFEVVTLPWGGYIGDWHNISFNKPFTLVAGETYNYTIRTGSYPQIHHTSSLQTANGWINCTSFVDVNERVYYDWIPAIRLWS